MKCVSVFGVLLAFAWSIVLFAPAGGSPEYRAITLLYTTDVHDTLLPFSYPDPPNAQVRYAAMSHIKNIGGVARIASIAKRIRDEKRGNTLLLDGGDLLEGTPFGLEYHGEADFAAFSAAGYDAMVPGNHDFTVPLAQVRKNLALADFAVVCANVTERDTGKLFLPPYRVFELDGVKVGVLGLITNSGVEKIKAISEGLVVSDPIEAAKTHVPELRKQADIVVVLYHNSPADTRKLVEEVKGIDVVFSGHAHARQDKPVLLATDTGGSAFRVNGTVYAYACENGGEVVRLDLILRKTDGRFSVMSFKGDLISVNSDVADDPATAKVIQRYYKPISKYYDEVVGEATETIYNDRSKENQALNVICDAMRESAGTQIAFYGEGGCRADILAGPVRMWDLSIVIPYKIRMVTMNLTGARIKQALERFIPGVSGMRYKAVAYTPTDGPRAGQLTGKLVYAEIDGQPIDDTAIYSVVTHEWLYTLYFQDVKDAKILDADCRSAVADYFRKHKKVSPAREGRRDVDRRILG